MKIAFVWHWEKAQKTYPNWRDGLRAAIETIEKTHDVTWFLGKDRLPDPNEKWDFILFWDDSNSSFFEKLPQYKCRKGICLTTNPHNIQNLKLVDVVYTESKPVHEQTRSHGLRSIRAFGTDINFFTPDPTVKKDIKYFYPATFSPWKRQSSIAHLGSDLLCVGTLQPDGYKELDACANNGVQVKRGYFPVECIRDYYRRAENVIIPAIHGSERTVLEAMSCGITPEVNMDNDKTFSLVDEFLDSEFDDPREFVVARYSHIQYADNLLKGMK